MVCKILLINVLNMLNRVARDPKWSADAAPLADQLGAALASQAAASSKGGSAGRGGGGKGSPAWTLVDMPTVRRWVRGAPAAAELVNAELGYEAIKRHTLSVYLSRDGQWGTTVETDNGTVLVSVRRASPAETEKLDAENGTEDAV